MAKSLREIFHTEKPIIGMIHLAGVTPGERLVRALEEIRIYDQEGLSGAIVEDYHGEVTDVGEFLDLLETKSKLNLTLGVNVLRDPYHGLELAGLYDLGFVQFDSVQTPDLDLKDYNSLRKQNPDVAVLGGVRFKYTRPTGRPLEQDLAEARQRCEVIVTTGEGTVISFFSSNESEIYFKKINPSTTCLYSAASILLLSLSAACQSFASKPMSPFVCAMLFLVSPTF